MPKVPEYSNFQTQVAGQPNMQFQAPSGPMPGSIAADQASQFGRAATAAGDMAGKIALDMQDQVNQVRVNDAMNQTRMAVQDLAYAKDSGFLSLKGNAALERPDGKSLNQEYGSKLEEQIRNLSDGLGNDAQRRAFQMQANDLSTQFHGQVETHMLQQFHTYSDSVDDATAKLASDGARLNWNNTDFINGHKDQATGAWTPGAIDQVKAAVMNKMQRAGLTGAPADAALLTGVSHVHTGVVEAALENGNAAYALSYLDQARKKGEISADDSLKLQGRVNQNVWMSQSLTAVQTAMAKAMPQIAPNNADRIVQITAQSESGTRDFNPDGSAVTSSAGAKYKMQVMPATAAKPGYGIPPAASDTPADYNRVGEAKLQVMLGRYGDPAKAWAAYNAGEGTVDKAIKKAEMSVALNKNDPTVQVHTYLDFLPKETRDYVAKNIQALGSGAAAVTPRKTELEFINDALAQLPAGAPPQAIKMTRDAAATQFGVINKSLQEKGDNALAESQRWIANNKGSTVDQMPPELMEAMKRFAPGKIDGLYQFSKALEVGDVVTNLRLYDRLTNNPGQLAQLSESAFFGLRRELSDADFKHFSTERAKLTGKTPGANGPGDLNTQAIKQTLDERLRVLKTDPTPKEGSDEAARVGGLRQFIDQYFYIAQREAGKKFTDAEVTQHIDALYAKNATVKGWFSSSSGPVLGMKIGDIGSDVKDRIKAAYKKNGVDNPTDADIMKIYFTSQTARK